MAENLSLFDTGVRTEKAECSYEHQSALDVTQRSRTSVLAWRGQFSPQLVEYLLTQNVGSRVFDPFCGSGTVLYEAAALGRSATGIDINPAAVVLATFATFCRMPMRERIKLRAKVREKIICGLSNHGSSELNLRFCETLPKEPFYACFLLTLFGDQRQASPKKALDVLESLSSKLLTLPLVEREVLAKRGDARFTDFPDHSFDLVITSPPYINVFNYHQNYRPAIEALGEVPLFAARSEIGANRKHRQNRFLTVIQYCMDMQAVFEELWRLISPGGRAIFVVGRSSKVRGVSFLNAELILKIASLTKTFVVLENEERSFLNRFGERIFESVITFSKSERKEFRHDDDELGRSVGGVALKDALESCQEPAVKEEIQDAYNKRRLVERSPRIS